MEGGREIEEGKEDREKERERETAKVRTQEESLIECKLSLNSACSEFSCLWLCLWFHEAA